MSLRYPAAVALTLAALVSARGVAAKAPGAGAAAAYPRVPVSVREVYSQRALKRARTILQLKLLELREQRLTCIGKAIERGIPADRLLKTWFSPNPKQANCDIL
jgi:hypothetical protein